MRDQSAQGIIRIALCCVREKGESCGDQLSAASIATANLRAIRTGQRRLNIVRMPVNMREICGTKLIRLAALMPAGNGKVVAWEAME
jgi:hypothetical protein